MSLQLEQELEGVREAHRQLEESSVRKQRLEAAMRVRLEAELARFRGTATRHRGTCTWRGVLCVCEAVSEWIMFLSLLVNSLVSDLGQFLFPLPPHCYYSPLQSVSSLFSSSLSPLMHLVAFQLIWGEGTVKAQQTWYHTH